jgi:hypothetical protein
VKDLGLPHITFPLWSICFGSQKSWFSAKSRTNDACDEMDAEITGGDGMSRY